MSRRSRIGRADATQWSRRRHGEVAPTPRRGRADATERGRADATERSRRRHGVVAPTPRSVCTLRAWSRRVDAVSRHRHGEATAPGALLKLDPSQQDAGTAPAGTSWARGLRRLGAVHRPCVRPSGDSQAVSLVLVARSRSPTTVGRGGPAARGPKAKMTSRSQPKTNASFVTNDEVLVVITLDKGLVQLWRVKV